MRCRINRNRPEMLVIVCVLPDKFEIKERIVICQLIYCLFCFFAITIEFPYKSAVFQLVKHFAQCTIALLVCCCYNFFASHTCLFSAESCYHIYVLFRRLEQRSIELVKLICQFPISGKEHFIDVLSKTKSFFKQVPIKWYASQYHIALGNLVSAHFNSLVLDEHFALFQSKWLKGNTLCHTIMKSSVVVNHLIDNPRCGRSAYNQNNILAG